MKDGEIISQFSAPEPQGTFTLRPRTIGHSADGLDWEAPATIGTGAFFLNSPPGFWFANGATLDGNRFTPLRPREPFDRSKIVVMHWSGIDITKEAQGIEKRQTPCSSRSYKAF